MQKFTLLLLLSCFLLTVHGENPPQKLSIGGRALSTQGKIQYSSSPRGELFLNSTTSGFSQAAELTGLKSQSKNVHLNTVSASGSDLQGFLKASSTADYPRGWYDIDISGKVDLLYPSTAMMGSCGYVREGKICQFSAINSYGYYWFYYSEYSLEDGEQLFEIELPDSDMRNYVINCAYDEKEDMVYMQTYSKNFTELAWSAFNPVTRERTYLNNGLSWEENRVVALANNPRDGKIYGIKDNGEYVEINKYSGVTSKVADLTVSPAEYSQSMIYAPVERGFVWAAMLSDNTSGFYRVEPSTGQVSLLGKMPAQNQFLMLYTPDKDASDAAPGMPSFSSKFEGPALTGDVIVTLPTETFGGEALGASAVIVADISIASETIATLKGKPGETVSGEVTLPQGYHDVTVKCRLESSDGWGPERKESFYVGYDQPVAPVGVIISNGKITWQAPTASVHGGYVDFSKIKYTVKLNDIEVTTQPTDATSVNFTEPSSLAIYYARVYAEADGQRSEPGVSEGVKFGNILQFPFSFTPDSKEFGLFTVVDGNKDGNKWTFFQGKDCIYYNTGNSRSADEWLILPVTDFSDTEHLYRLSFEVRALLASLPEDFEIWLLSGTDPVSGQVQKIASYPGYNKDEWTDETIKFNVAEVGQYHIAFHCTSAAGFQLMLQKIRGEKTADTMKAPAECKGVKVEGATGGKLEGTASFLAPTKALDGTALDAAQEITIYARTAAGEASVKVLPGQKGEVTFPCVQGMNKVTLVTANESGEGIENTYEVFAGQEKPGKVQNLQSTVSDDNLTWTITWDAPVEGESGGYINPDDVGYYIFNVSDGELSFLEDIGKQRSYTYKVAPGQQSLEQLAVGPYNIAGSSSSDTFRGTSTILGTPLEVPFTETFGYGIPRYLPNVITRPNSSYTAQWSHGDPTAIVYDALTADYGCMFAQPSVAGLSLGRVEIPRVSTAGYKNICFKLRAFRFPQGGVIRILGRENNGAQYVEIGEFDSSKGTKGYVESIFKLPAQLQNKPWISLAIEAEFDNESINTFVIIDEYSVVDLPDNDMAVQVISGSDRLKAGEIGNYVATVANLGKEAQTSSVLWKATDSQGNIIHSETKVVSPLDPEESEVSDFSFSAAGLSMGEFAIVSATAVADPDDSDANDTKEMKVALLSAGSGMVNDLQSSVENNNVTLTWSAPQMKESLNDDFGNLEHGLFDSSLGAWKNVDGDGKNVCSINGVEIPEAGKPKGWQVIDQSLHALFAANKGTKFLLAMTPADESAANDWLISPEVVGNSEVVFSVNTLTTGFSEEFEVLVSSTDDNIASFRNLASFEKSTPEWETYMVKLPSDARFFAIRYCSVDQFGIMLDNVDYVPATAPEQKISGYNIYRDNTLLAKSEKNEYVDETPLKEASYHIIPLVNENGSDVETIKSNTVTVATSGINSIDGSYGVFGSTQKILVRGLEGKTISIFGADGVLVNELIPDSSRFEIPASTGVYMIYFNGKAVKVLVK